MSITGQPQEINTVKSSWEVLDTPVPLRPETSNHPCNPTDTPSHSYNPTSKALSPDSNKTSVYASLMPESSGYLTEQNIEISVEDALPKYNSSPVETPEYSRKPEHNLEHFVDENSFCTEKSNKTVELSRGSNSRGTAMFVSSQRCPTVDIAETIAAEFENRIRKTRSAQRERKSEEASEMENVQDNHMPDDTANTDFRYSTEETNISNLISTNETNSELPSQDISAEVLDLNVTEKRPLQSREHIKLPKITKSMNQSPDKLSTISQLNGQHDSVNKSHGSSGNRNITERDRLQQRDRNPQTEHTGPVSHTSSEHPRNQLHESRNRHRPSHQHQHTPGRQTNSLRAQTATDRQRDSRRGDLNIQNGNSSTPEEMEEAHPREDEAISSRQNGPLSYVPIPTYHPPPTIIQNGISQKDLLDVMSKGLGQFTSEMASMVLEKLKPEHEALAKQVGLEVKESTVFELQDLREKLKISGTEIEALKVERDNLKVENSKERDQMKKDFEKDRLKRVKEFEEKKELIESLQKENEKLKTTLGEKDKSLKKALAKAKSEEQKCKSLIEESENKQKELQKELNKIKGELLVQKSKKRLQVSSAQSRKECLGKLNSKHGTYIASKHFNGHMPVKYDEGDD